MAHGRLNSGFAFLLAAAVSAPCAAAPHEWGLPIPAPRQLMSAETRLDPKYNERSGGDSGTYMVVDLGQAGGPPPNIDETQMWTILGERGWAHGRLADIEKRCEYLCGVEDGAESCYYVALIAPDEDPARIGRPLAATPGTFDLLEYTVLDDGAPPDRHFQLKLSDRFAGILKRAYAGSVEEEDYRLDYYDGDAMKLSVRWRNENSEQIYEIEGRKCSAKSYGYFQLTEISCDAFSALAGDEVLLVSQADYNAPKATPLAEFTVGGSKYYVVRFGAKAEDIVGLVAAAPSGWRGLFQGRGRDLLC